MGVNKVHIVQLLKKKRERLIQVYIVTVCVFASSILFLFPQRTHYFWRVSRFLFMERKQDYNVTSVKNVKVCFQRRKYQKQWTYLLNESGSFRPDYLFAPGRFAPLNRYYIIIDEVFYDNFLGNYLFISCMAKKKYMCVYGHPTHPIFQPPTLSIFTQNLDNHFCCLISCNVLFIQPLAFCRNWVQRR